MGKGVSQKGIQRIEFVIRQDGTVEETVTGVKGAHCESVRFLHLYFCAFHHAWS